MSIFKTIGSKLKRVISLKNVISAATGNFTAVTADMARVMTTKSPSELKKEADSKANGIAYVSPEQTIPTDVVPTHCGANRFRADFSHRLSHGPAGGWAPGAERKPARSIPARASRADAATGFAGAWP
jgi:hypothetical protein